MKNKIQSKELLFENLRKLNPDLNKLNEGIMGLKDNPLITQPLKAMGLLKYLPDISEFDIAEALATYIHDYNDNSEIITKLKQLVRDVQFKPSPMFSYNEKDLDLPAGQVYDSLVSYYSENPSIEKTYDDNFAPKNVLDYSMNELVNATGLPQQLQPTQATVPTQAPNPTQIAPAPSDVKTLNTVQQRASSANNAAKRIDNSTEFTGAFQNWFSTLGYTPQKISKSKVLSEVSKVLINLGYR